MSDRLTALSDRRASIWLDDLRREGLVLGSLAALAAGHHGAGITTNDAVQKLEDEGMAAFDASWDRLREQLSATLCAQPARRQRS